MPGIGNLYRSLSENRFTSKYPILTAGGYLCLLFYVATAVVAPPIADEFKKALILAAGIAFVFLKPPIRKSPAFIFLLIGCCIPVVSWIAIHLSYPQYAESSPEAQRVANWFMFIPAAVFIGGVRRKIYLLWAVALLSLLLAPWLTGQGLDEWVRGLTGQRVDFGLRNAQHTALLFATGFLGLIVFRRRYVDSFPRFPGLMHVSWLVFVVIFYFAVIVSQTRGVWLGSIAALLVGTIVYFFLNESRPRAGVRSWKVLLLIGLLVALVAPVATIIVKRVDFESDGIHRIFTGELPDIARNSTGVRVNSWREAMDWIPQRPVLGWGGEGRKIVAQHAAIVSQEGKPFGHLHSTYFDVLVNYGAMGLLLLVSLVVWMVHLGRGMLRAGRLPNDLYLFVIVYLAFFAVANLFESYLFYTSGYYTLSLVFGPLLSLVWAEKTVAR